MASNFSSRVAYASNNGPFANVFNPPIKAQRNPTVSDLLPIGQVWCNVVNSTVWIEASIIANQATWVQVTPAGGAGNFASLTVTPGPISLTGTTTINTVAGAQNTSIGSGGNTGSILIGNVGNTVTAITGANSAIDSSAAGTIGIGAVSQATGIINIGTSQTTGVLNVGGTLQTGAIAFGVSTAGQIINMANAVNTAPQIVNISSGASGANSTVNILTGTATAGVQTLNLGNSSGSSVATNVGSNQGASLTSIFGGTSGIQISTGTGVATRGQVGVTPQFIAPTAGVTATGATRIGYIHFTGQTTPATTAGPILVITNPNISVNSAIFTNIYAVTATAGVQMQVIGQSVQANTLTVFTYNSGSAALDGDLVLQYWIMN